eukprot:scaffold7762_cov390-Prasinococcus_capsulatus_cf.AAC.3
MYSADNSCLGATLTFQKKIAVRWSVRQATSRQHNVSYMQPSKECYAASSTASSTLRQRNESEREQGTRARAPQTARQPQYSQDIHTCVHVAYSTFRGTIETPSFAASFGIPKNLDLFSWVSMSRVFATGVASGKSVLPPSSTSFNDAGNPALLGIAPVAWALRHSAARRIHKYDAQPSSLSHNESTLLSRIHLPTFGSGRRRET